MKYRLIAILFAATSLLLAACTTTPGKTGDLSTATVPDAMETEKTYTVTGSRIVRRSSPDEGAIPQAPWPVVVFSQEDLEVTGHHDLDMALMMLYPGFY